MDVLRWEGERLYLLDQRELPHRVEYLPCSHYRDVAAAIRQLSVRGAPAIGVAAAFGYALAAFNYPKMEKWPCRSTWKRLPGNYWQRARRPSISAGRLTR